MRIGILAPLVTPIAEPQLGGSQAVVADLSSALAARGHDVEVLAASGSAIPGAAVVDTGVDSSVLAGDLVRPGAAPRVPSRAALEAYERVLALLGEREHDVVHNHGFDVPAVDALTRLRVPVVHTLHLPPDELVAGALRGALRSPNPPATVCVSQAQAQGWRASGVRVHAIVRNGVPTREIPWSPIADGAPLFAGRLSAEKGADLAIEIARLAGVELIVHGIGYDSHYEARLREQDGVRIEPPLPRRQLWRRMARARAVLCPARWDEPFGMVAAEAQAAGTPVIGFARGGLPEVVQDGVTGALLPDGDVAKAAEALADVARFERPACRRHAERTLDIATAVQAHERLYAWLVRATRRAQAR